MMKKLFSKMMIVAMAALSFTACEDVPEPYDIPGSGENTPGSIEIEGATGTGTLEDPFNAPAALNYGSSLASGEESPGYYYIKGKVVSIREEFTTQYGNGTFYISADGTTQNQFYVYRVLYLGNKRFTDSDTQIKVGDEVVICAVITNYNGTIETAQNKGFLYSLNGENRGGEQQNGDMGTPEGDGSLNSPYNIPGVLKYIGTLGTEESPNEVYIKGKIASITEEFGTQYGNGTFYISDDGTESNTFYVYRVLYLGNKRFADGDTQIKKGDDVIICGKVVNFRGNTPETVQGSSYLYSLNGVTEGNGGDTPQPGGTEVTCTQAVELTNALADGGTSTETYTVTGYITEVVGSVSRNQQTFWMADTKDGGHVFEAYWADLPDGVTEFKAGMKVKITGNLMKYVKDGVVTPEIKNATVEILEAGGDTPQPSGTEVTCAQAAELTNALADGGTSTETYTVTGYITEVVGSVSRNQQTFWMADTKDGGHVFEAYWANLPSGVSEFSVGMKVKISGNLMKYVNNSGEVTPEIKNADVEILEGGDSNPSGGGDNPSGDGFGTLSGNVLTLVVADLGVDNGTEPGTIKLVDGTTLSFDGGGNANTPKYYTSGASIRMYPNNSMTVKANGKTIQSIVFTCSSQSGTLCNASGDVTASPGTVSTSGDDVNVNSINSSSTTITDSSTTTGAPSQLRFSKLVITYSE